MASFKTHNFLPEVFRTDSNKKFLNATLDQLISEPKFKKVSGYIGRTFAPTYRAGDGYVQETSASRQQYQLEPGVVSVDAAADSVDFYSSYSDIVNKLAYYGANTQDHSRLFSSEFYSYDGKFDFDKFVNFSNYCWMPNGPDAVTVSSSGTPLRASWDVTVNSSNGLFYFNGKTLEQGNVDLTVAHGGIYEFTVGEGAGPLYIQTHPGQLGFDPARPNIGTRAVFGVENNGADSGVITFRVPQPSGQDKFVKMPQVAEVDYATELEFKDIHGVGIEQFSAKFPGLDGVTPGLNGRSLIFVGRNNIDDSSWETSSGQIDKALRKNVWRILINQDGIISLIPSTVVNQQERVLVAAGQAHATKQFYLDFHDLFNEVPLITAPLTKLYLQSGQLGSAVSVINLVQPVNQVLRPELEILGKTSYTSPNGVKFTNGLKVKFDTLTTDEFAGQEFYVAGVGTAIQLVSVTELIAPEIWKNTQVDSTSSGIGYTVGDILAVAADTGERSAIVRVRSVTSTGAVTQVDVLDSGHYSRLLSGSIAVSGGSGSGLKLILSLQPTSIDYVTVDRVGYDRNAWARHNRWTHVEVIKYTAELNGTDINIDQQFLAKRPIIEFAAGLQLFNHGNRALAHINYLDFSVTDAYSQIENLPTQSASVLTLVSSGKSISFRHNDRVIFSADTNPDVSAKVYRIEIVDIGENPFAPEYIGRIVEEADPEVTEGVSVLAKNNAGAKQYWFNGDEWVVAQTKDLQKAPMFDVYDSNGRSFGDSTFYTNTDFAGTQIFGYTLGAGTADPVLGFPLSYRSFNNVGDIQFTNFFDTGTVTYLVGPVTQTAQVNSGFMRQYRENGEFAVANVWQKVTSDSHQYQLISYVYDGKNNLFEVDILPSAIVQPPSIKVLVNSVQLPTDKFGLTQIGERFAVLVADSALTESDTVNILIYSEETSGLGFYQIPSNLDNNSLNENFSTLTLGQLRNHLIAISANSADITGAVPGSNNLRDLPTKSRGGSILKHSAPVVYSAAFLVSETLNFVDSVKLAQREYSKFKNKFLELATTIELDVIDIAGSVDRIIDKINAVKNSSFPWHYSDMVPMGRDRTTLPAYTVLDPRIKTYELSSIFNDSQLSSRAVLVYLTRTLDNKTTTRLLTKDRDYSFSQSYPAVVISDSFGLNYNDKITIVEYSSTDGCYVPETPTKLGLHPKFMPELYLDNTYLVPTRVIQGHDGSLTPAFGDYRDDLLMELELRIYNNIKVTAQDLVVDLPGRFRNTEYSHKEFTQVLSSSFLSWVGANRLDFSANTAFQSNNPWTWNYKNFKDTISGEFLTGSWRAIFMSLYDTMRPHTHPWEMLGFSTRPNWWVDRYGPAPYTGGNLTLWTDLSQGRIYAGDRAGIDARYVRPELLKLIPVDESGNLISPEKYAVLDFDSARANASFAVGDIGPAESAWRKSSDYAFALQIAAALTKPAKYFSLCANITGYKKNQQLDQYIVTATNQHITTGDFAVNGAANGQVKSAGYVNWVSEFLKNLGISEPGEVITGFMRNLAVQLNYRVAGFTDKKFLKILAEQGSPTSTNTSIVIPDENYQIFVNKSVPVDRIVYSAVIVEKSANGYTVGGYDLSNPYFSLIPSRVNNNAFTITVNKRSGTIYQEFESRVDQIPYGTEFASSQEVVDFLVSYQRYLQSQGFAFIDRDADLQIERNWLLSAREFLTWAQQGWSTGNVLVLSPVKDVLRVVTSDSQVDVIKNSPAGSKLLDLNFNAIKQTDFSVTRSDNEFTVSCSAGKVIALADLSLVQHEHVVLFDNATVFNDIIYSPATGNRQFRLKLVGHKTADWAGEMNPPGFVYNRPKVDLWQPGRDYRKGSLVSFKDFYYTAIENVVAAEQFNLPDWQQVDQTQIKTGLLPNFATNASLFESIYDVDNSPFSENIGFYSTGLIGFRERSYLTDLSVDAETQTKFYQGLIKQKGTLSAIEALASVQLNNSNNGISVYEEWAVRVGEYGSTESNQYVEVVLDESAVTANPAAIEFVDNIGAASAGAVVYTPGDWYQSSKNNSSSMFDRYVSATEQVELPTAGYVNLLDVDATIFDLADYRTLTSRLGEISVGHTIWTARDFSGQWNVYRVSETNNNVVSLSYNMDNIATVTTRLANSIDAGDVVAIKGFSAEINDVATLFDGFYQVYSRVDDFNFTVVLVNGYKELRDAKIIYDNAVLFKLVSSRVGTVDQIKDIEPEFGWTPSDFIWVDSATSEGWGVYRRNSPWEYSTESQLNASEYSGGDQFGAAIAVSQTGQFMYVGAPGNQLGRVAGYVKQSNGDWLENVSLSGSNPTTRGFGNAVSLTPRALVVAASQSSNSAGQLFTYRERQSAVNQVLVGKSAGELFGSAICASRDGSWLYVGAPGANRVSAYTWQDTEPFSLQAREGATTVTLARAVAAATDVVVLGAVTYIPGIDYQLESNGTVIRFTRTLTEAVLVLGTSGYRLVSEITVPGIDVDAKFGAAISCSDDGATLVIGAPESSIAAFNSGAAWVFSRSIEKFVASGTKNSFALQNDASDFLTVTVNGVPQIPGVNFVLADRAVQLNATPGPGQLVVVDTNEFNLIEQLSLPASSGQLAGTSVAITADGSDILIGSPGFRTSEYLSGIVYRFTSPAKTYGLVSSQANPVVSSGSLVVNGTTVLVPAASPDAVVAAIQTSGIPGVTAEFKAGRVVISSTKLGTNRLTVTPGSDSLFDQLGLTAYALSQEVKHPGASSGEFFGTVVGVSRDEKTLVVGSRNASVSEQMNFDSRSIEFDSGATSFSDQVFNSGAVYVFDLIDRFAASAQAPSLFEFTQELRAPVTSGVDFGAAVAIENSSIFVGATRSLLGNVNSGSAIEFVNATNQPGWALVQQAAARVDFRSISKSFIYNKNSKTILSYLDIFDPAKGKLLGPVAQVVDYLTEYDPAVYNTGGENTNESLSWSESQVGRIWWDLSQVRYVEYEQGSLAYRNANWGRLFPGSNVRVYEWVESDFTPAQYVSQGGNGTPKFDDNSNYSTVTYVDPATGSVKSRNYFWVTGKTVAAESKNLSVYDVEQAIIDPVSQGTPFIAVTADNAVSLFNVSQYLSGKSAVLHIDHSPIRDTNVIHTEYELIKENSSDVKIPARIVNKLQDSLAGIDASGNIVPDPNLGPAARYGIEIRPRQTLFVDRFTALKNFVENLNKIFATTPVADSRDVSKLFFGEPLPVANTGVYDQEYASKTELDFANLDELADGFRALIPADADNDGLWTIYQLDKLKGTWSLVRIQSYLTGLYSELIDWYAPGFDSATRVDYIVPNYNALLALALVEKDIVRVIDNGDGRFAIYQLVNGTVEKVGSQKGTVRILPTIYDLSAGNMGFDNDNFDTIRFDQSPDLETRSVFDSAVNDILIKDLAVEFNRTFFSLVNYLLTEQTAPDWIFKTSFISVVHNIRDLAQYPSYIKDNQTYYESYINEVKPYRTSIREYLPTQSAVDFMYAGATDFDLAGGDRDSWAQAYRYSVAGVTVARGGSGYTLPPSITIQGGGGKGATARAVLGGNGSIQSVILTSPGQDYTSTPVITVQGNGTGAVLVPELANQFSKYSSVPSYNTVRNIETTLKFDRVLDSRSGTGELILDSNVVEWFPNTSYAAQVTVINGAPVLESGKLVAYDGKIYLPVQADIGTEETFDANLYQLVESGNVLIASAERVQGYYFPGPGMVSKSLVKMIDSEYPGVLLTGVEFAGDQNGIDTTIGSDYLDTELGARPEDINVDGGEYVDIYNSHAPEEMLPGRVFETLDIQVFTANTSGYTTNAFTIGQVLVHNGGLGYTMGEISVTAVGINGAVLVPVLDKNGTILSITIEQGGSGLSVMADPVIQVTGNNAEPAVVTAKLTQSAYGLVGYRYFYDMKENLTYSRISSVNTTRLTESLTLDDEFIYVDDASVLSAPDVERARPGRIYIDGELITFYTVDLVENKLGQLRRAVSGTGAASIHLAGASVTDAGSDQTIPGADTHVSTWLNLGPGVSKFIVVDTGEELADDLDQSIVTTAITNGTTGALAVTDGTGLMGSLTQQALFIKM